MSLGGWVGGLVAGFSENIAISAPQLKLGLGLGLSLAIHQNQIRSLDQKSFLKELNQRKTTAKRKKEIEEEKENRNQI